MYLTTSNCPECDGTRLRKSARHVFIDNRRLEEIVALPVGESSDYFENLDLSSYRVSGTYRCTEAPIDMEKDRSRAGQLFGHHGIQDGACNTALDDDLSKTTGFRDLLFVVNRVPVPADLGKAGNVFAAHRTREFGHLAL